LFFINKIVYIYTIIIKTKTEIMGKINIFLNLEDLNNPKLEITENKKRKKKSDDKFYENLNKYKDFI